MSHMRLPCPFAGKIEGGPGKRLLFEVLGNHTFTCSAEFPYEIFEPEISDGEMTSFTFRPEGMSIEVSSEGAQQVLDELRKVRSEIANHMTLSQLKGDFAPFRKWAGQNPETK